MYVMQTEGRAPLSGDNASTRPGDGDLSAEPAVQRRRLRLLVTVAFLVVLLDQISKYLIVRNMSAREPISLLGGFLTITYTRNPGAAFSLGTGFTFLFTGVALAVVVVILRTATRLFSIWWALALGALLGGAIGNLADRMFRAPGVGRGYVVDWIQLPHFAVFNLADSAITCAAVAIVLLSLLGYELDGRRATRPAKAGPPDPSASDPSVSNPSAPGSEQEKSPLE